MEKNMFQTTNQSWCSSIFFPNPIPAPPGDIEPHAQLSGTHGSAAQLAIPVAVGRVPISDGEPIAGPGVIGVSAI